jgi:GntR family transcriptional regulator
VYLQIDPGNGSPIYLQIIEQIKRAIAIGVFETGKPLPTIREIAIELRVNPNTVAKSIRELEREGVIKTFVGKGSFVSEKSGNITKQENQEKAMKIVEQFIKDIQWLGLDKDQAIKLLEQNWDDLVMENSLNDK